MVYLFDTNIFIYSKNEMPIDVWPTFWDRMNGMINSGKVYSSIKVQEEINRGNDELPLWLQENTPKGFYLPLTTEVLQRYEDTQNWANSREQFTESALRTFANTADAYLIATAAANGMTLVTFEKSNLQAKKRVMIPDVCDALGVRYCDLNTALREMDITI